MKKTIGNEYTYPENILSFLRIPLAVLFVFFHTSEKVMVIILILAAVTDILDGRVARAYKRSSSLGEFLDPLADKIFYGTAVITLFFKQHIAWIFLPLFLLREIVIIGAIFWRNKKGKRKTVYKAMPWGKRTTVIQWCVLLTLVFTPAFAGIGSILAGIAGYKAVIEYKERML